KLRSRRGPGSELRGWNVEIETATRHVDHDAIAVADLADGPAGGAFRGHLRAGQALEAEPGELPVGNEGYVLRETRRIDCEQNQRGAAAHRGPALDPLTAQHEYIPLLKLA